MKTQKLPVIILLKPGAAAEKSLKFPLPAELQGESVGARSIISYGLGLTQQDGLTRDGLRVRDRIRTEMNGRYGIAVNGTPVNEEQNIVPYLREEKTTGKKVYLKGEIIIAARQEGADGLDTRF